MGGKEGLGEEVFAAGMAGVSDERHVGSEIAVGDFALDGAARVIRRIVPLGTPCFDWSS